MPFKLCGFILSCSYSGINHSGDLATAAMWEEVGTKYSEDRMLRTVCDVVPQKEAGEHRG